MSKQPRQIKANKKADCIRQDNQSASETTNSQPIGNESMNSLTVLNHEIHQYQNLYSLNDLHKASGNAKKHQPAFFMRNQETKDLVAELELECSANMQNTKPVVSLRGNKADGTPQGTYVCKEIVYRYAMWISPKFALAVIRVFDAFVTGNLEPKRLTISIEQQKAIRFAVAKRANGVRPHFQTVYTALYREFDIPRYTELLASDFDEAIKFIQTVELVPQIEHKEFSLVEGKIVNQAMDYVYSLQREIKRLGGNLPSFEFDSQTIAESIITRMVHGKRLMLSFDYDSGSRIKFIPQDHWVITEDNIATIIADNEGVKKSKLPEIMSALFSRMGFNH